MFACYPQWTWPTPPNPEPPRETKCIIHRRFFLFVHHPPIVLFVSASSAEEHYVCKTTSLTWKNGKVEKKHNLTPGAQQRSWQLLLLLPHYYYHYYNTAILQYHTFQETQDLLQTKNERAQRECAWRCKIRIKHSETAGERLQTSTGDDATADTLLTSHSPKKTAISCGTLTPLQTGTLLRFLIKHLYLPNFSEFSRSLPPEV